MEKDHKNTKLNQQAKNQSKEVNKLRQNNTSYNEFFTVIPSQVVYDKNISWFDKILYGTILSLSSKNGYCCASNGYFAKQFSACTSTISKSISNLALKGYLVQELTKHVMGGTKRKIFVSVKVETNPYGISPLQSESQIASEIAEKELNPSNVPPKIFYTIIPSQIVYDKDISWFDKILYGTILSLSSKNGYCYASNDYLAKQFDVSISSISKSISALVSKEYLKLDIKRLMTGAKRKIYVTVRIETNQNAISPLQSESQIASEIAEKELNLSNVSSKKFYTIIPSQIVYDKDISWFDKILYGTILSLSSKNGYCCASNGYLAKQFDVSTSSISKSVSALVSKEYLKLDIKRLMTGAKRKIYVTVRIETNQNAISSLQSELQIASEIAEKELNLSNVPPKIFYTIIPSQIVYDKDISWFDKILYGTILSLSSKNGYCYASNGYLAKQFDVSTSSISKSVSALVSKEYLKLDIKRLMKGAKRKIYVTVKV